MKNKLIKVSVMKLKILNILSGVAFFISSVCLLSIPFLDLKEGFTVTAFVFAGLFWGGIAFRPRSANNTCERVQEITGYKK